MRKDFDKNGKKYVRKNEKWLKFVSERKPEEWLADIEKIKNYILRIKVSCIVYWDYFGDNLQIERWPHLDFYVNQYRKIDETMFTLEELKEGLIIAGYFPRIAKRRAKIII